MSSPASTPTGCSAPAPPWTPPGCATCWGTTSLWTPATSTPMSSASTATASSSPGARPWWPPNPCWISASTPTASSAWKRCRKSAWRCGTPPRKSSRPSAPLTTASAWPGAHCPGGALQREQRPHRVRPAAGGVRPAGRVRRGACIVNRNGVDRVLELSLTEEERQKLADSCAILQESYQGLEL